MKIKLNLYTNIILFILLIVSAISGLLLWFVLPKGNSYQGGRNSEVLDPAFIFTRHNWIDIHNYSSLIFVILLIIHLILHWSWIKNLPKLLKTK